MTEINAKTITEARAASLRAHWDAGADGLDDEALTRAQAKAARALARFDRMVEQAEKIIEARLREYIRAGQVPLGAPATAGALAYALREFEADMVWRILGKLVGNRRGAETDGEVGIVGYSAGCEIFGFKHHG